MRIVLCDDHRLLLDALTLALVRAGHEVVAAVTEPSGLVDLVAQTRPDACLLDLHFPQTDPASVLEGIAAASPGTRIVVLSATDRPESLVAVLSTGAHGFVSKRRGVADIVSSLERRTRPGSGGQVPGHPELAAFSVALQSLTTREREVLRCLLDGRPTAQIAQQLGVRVSTARTHVQNLLDKLGVCSRLQAAALVTAHAEAVLRAGSWEAS